MGVDISVHVFTKTCNIFFNFGPLKILSSSFVISDQLPRLNREFLNFGAYFCDYGPSILGLALVARVTHPIILKLMPSSFPLSRQELTLQKWHLYTLEYVILEVRTLF